jgi:hypothetical protein
MEDCQAAQSLMSGSQPSGKGPAEYFTGTVRIDPLFEALAISWSFRSICFKTDNLVLTHLRKPTASS